MTEEMSAGQLIETEKFQEEYQKQRMEELQNKKNPFYRYRVIDYYETGCGRKIFLQISQYSKEHSKNRWEQFVGDNYYLEGTEELFEREFLDRYTRLLPNMIASLHREKTLTIWETHFHFNRA